jgi:hypothetical protein
MKRSVDSIRSYAIEQYVVPARRKGEQRVQIVAGDVHRGLRLKNRVPNVCNALTSRIFLKENSLEIEDVSGPPSGMGTRMTYTYRLLNEDEKPTPAARTAAPNFEALHGILKGAFRRVGGSEVFLRRERDHFYEPDRETK